MADWTVAALYKFVSLKNTAALQGPLLKLCERSGICGSILLADEGINGTVSGSRAALMRLFAFLAGIKGLEEIEVKFSASAERPFKRMKVRLKSEIVKMGVPGIDPNQTVGTYVDPLDWNELISDPETLVIDTRNDFEVEIGTFTGAVDPNTRSFGQFPKWADNNVPLEGEKKPKRIAMFCTGGIRCEKATAYMKEAGHDEVFHLKGGILKYLEHVPPEESMWEGECFVFDDRVSLVHGLEEGTHTSCHACGRPISPEGLKSPHYIEGIQCEACRNEYSETARRRFAIRHEQAKKLEAEGKAHLGDAARKPSHQKGRG